MWLHEYYCLDSSIYLHAFDEQFWYCYCPGMCYVWNLRTLWIGFEWHVVIVCRRFNTCCFVNFFKECTLRIMQVSLLWSFDMAHLFLTNRFSTIWVNRFSTVWVHSHWGLSSNFKVWKDLRRVIMFKEPWTMSLTYSLILANMDMR